MAAVTVNSYTTNVNGNLRDDVYNVTGASTNTLATAMKTIKSVSFNDTTISKAAVSGGTITFTSSGTYTNALIRVLGV